LINIQALHTKRWDVHLVEVKYHDTTRETIGPIGEQIERRN